MSPAHDDRGIRARLDAELARLPPELPPARDLWPGIASRLEARSDPDSGSGTRRPRAWLGQLAAALLLMAGSSAITAALLRNAGPREASLQAGPTLPSPADARGMSRAVAYAPGYAPGPEYLAARQQMLDALARRLDQLPPATRVAIAGNLAEIRLGADKIAAALAEQPGDPLLEELLLNAYQDELAMLATVDQVTRTQGARGADEPKVQL